MATLSPEQVDTLIQDAKTSLDRSCTDPQYRDLPGCTSLPRIQPSHTPALTASRMEALRSLFESMGIPPLSEPSGYSDVDTELPVDLIGYVTRAREI